MHISKITIKGFRSFGPKGCTINIDNKLGAFIGHNSSGKTAALEALRKMFGLSNAERELYRQDFHIANGEDLENIESKDLSIEARFDFGDEDGAVPHFFESMVIDSEGEKPYLRVRLEGNWLKTPASQEGEVESILYVISVPEGSDETEDNKRIFPRHLRGLIQVLYVPAIRKPSDQIKYVSGSILYRVLRLLKWDDDIKGEFESKISEINALFSGLKEFEAIQKSLTGFWRKFHKDKRYSESNLGFGNSDLESVLKKLEVSFSPTGTHREFQVNDLGEGYRSLFYLTLVCALLEVEEQFSASDEGISKNIRPVLTILAIEEPENHISPQLLGRIVKILQTLSEQEKTQVFLSSHTPAIIKRIDPESIFHFRITDKFTTEINAITLPPKTEDAYKYVKEAIRNYPEIYFAKLAVIGEGDSEDVIFNKLMEVNDLDFDDNMITFVPLGHRFVNHIWKLLETLHIPYVTLLDLDIERNGGGWGRIKYILNQLIESGIKKKKLLKLSDDTVLSDEDLQKMHTWGFSDNKLDVINGWVTFLEKYNVFYSSPLDLDFLLLKHYTKVYKKAIPKGGGPQIPDKAAEADKFSKKLDSSLHATLKSEKAKGLTYSDEEKELMIWYNYHFLGRGKPVTHINALALMDEKTIKKSMPDVFTKIFERINKLLAN